MTTPQLSHNSEWVARSSIAYVSQSPPMIPDGRFSRIRFEAAAYTVRLPTARASLSRGRHTLSLAEVYAPPSSR